MQFLGHEIKKGWILIDSWSPCCLFDLLWILCHLSAIPANTCQSTIDYGLKYSFKSLWVFFFNFTLISFSSLHSSHRSNAILPMNLFTS